MDFSDALTLVKSGHMMARAGWNGRLAGDTMFIYLVGGSTFKVNRAPLSTIFPEGTSIVYQPHIDLRTAQNTCVPWLASQGDLLAGDWEITYEIGRGFLEDPDFAEVEERPPAPNTKAMAHENEDPPHAERETRGDQER